MNLSNTIQKNTLGWVKPMIYILSDWVLTTENIENIEKNLIFLS